MPSSPVMNYGFPSSKPTARSWFSRHRYISAFILLSIIGMIVSFLLNYTAWGYAIRLKVGSPFGVPVQSFVSIDSLYAFRIASEGQPAHAEIYKPEKSPAELMNIRPGDYKAQPRLLIALYKRGLLPTTWNNSSISEEIFSELACGRKSAYSREFHSLVNRRIDGYVAEGRDSAGSKVMLISSYDWTGAPSDCFIQEVLFQYIPEDDDWSFARSLSIHTGGTSTRFWEMARDFEILIVILLAVVKFIIWAIRRTFFQPETVHGFDVIIKKHGE